jgi:predicted phage terminase large subunit-like protein
VAAFRARWAAVYPEQALPLVIESVGGGQVAAQELRAGCDFPVVEYQVRGSKMARNEAASPLAEGGLVWLPEPGRAPWVRAWLDELVGFPQLPHDDRVDAACMALARLREYVEPAHVALPPVRRAWERRWRY